MALVAVPAGRIVDRVGHFPVVLGGAVIYTVGFGQFWLVAGDNRSNLILLIALGGAGIGMGTVYPTTMSAAVFGMRADRLGSASAVVNATNRVGGAFGVALLAALVANETGTTTSSQHLQAVSIMPIVGLAVIGLSFGLRGQSGPGSHSTRMQSTGKDYH
jgi:fucose permease